MEKQQTAVALGFFDGVHQGHRRVIEKAVALAQGQLIPAVFTFTMDGSGPAKKQGAGEITTLEQKIRILKKMGIQEIYAPDFATFRDLSGEVFVRQILKERMHAAEVCCGQDFRFGKGASCDAAALARFCKESGIDCTVLEEVLDGGEAVSSTRVRKAIAAGEMEKAERLLGHRYFLDFPVEHGKALGRKLQFPTINQPIPPQMLLPRLGVYATMAEVDRKMYAGVTNIGVRPTVEQGMAPRAETYLIGFTGDLYGKSVPVAFLSFLRPEQKFDSVEALREQIARDAGKAAEIAKKALQSESFMI
ncbi:MAG: bifunctional riboflavin kinase/FAD synthetase [Oscillospiraceae bacterium]|nr:bifunctional riboflavin kinase/FAD synthetase [Oscillospiraceae bacterium]